MSPAPELQFYYEPYALGQPQVPPIPTDDSQGLRRCPQRRRHCLAGDVRAVRTFCEWGRCFTDEG
jgi:hypothetical protein